VAGHTKGGLTEKLLDRKMWERKTAGATIREFAPNPFFVIFLSGNFSVVHASPLIQQ
jgi:hypothetical protein